MTIEKLPKCRTNCTVEISPEERLPAEEQALKRLGTTVHLKGFRPGKAPLDVLREHVDAEELVKETVHGLLPSLLQTAMTEHKLAPILAPRVQILSADPLRLSLLFVEMPPVKIRADKIKLVPKPTITVESAEIDAFIRQITWHDHTESEVSRSAEKGDLVRLDLQTTGKDGVKVDALTASNARVIVGESSILPEIDAVLPGMKAGDEKTLAITLPKEFPTKELQGKKVICVWKVLAVIAITMPALTAEYVKEKLKIEKSPEQFRTDIEEMIRRRKEGELKQKREEEFFTAVRTHTAVELADELVASEMEQMAQSLQKRLSDQDMTFESWLKTTGKTAEQVTTEMKQSAAERLTLQLGIRELIKEKQITVEDELVAKATADALASAESHGEHVHNEEFQPGGSEFEHIRSEQQVEKLMEAYGV